MTNRTIKTIYSIMFVFVLYHTYKIITSRIKLSKDQLKFKQKKNLMLILLNFLLIVMIFLAKDWYLRIIILGMSIYFLYINTEPIIFTEKGIYHNGRTDGWENLKKWAYDDSSKGLIIQVKKDGRDQQRLLPIDPKEKEIALEKVREHKKK